MIENTCNIEKHVYVLKKEKEFLYINKKKVDNPVENQGKDLNRYFTKEDT